MQRPAEVRYDMSGARSRGGGSAKGGMRSLDHDVRCCLQLYCIYRNLHSLCSKMILLLFLTPAAMASLSMVTSTSRAALSSPLRCACRAPAYTNTLGRRTLFGFGGSKKKQKSDQFQDGITAAPARPTLSQDDLFHPVRLACWLLARNAKLFLTPSTMMLFCSYRNRPFQRCARRLLV